MLIDARGKNCPIPVIMAKKAIDDHCLNFTVLVDNAIAVENLKKLAKSKGYPFQVETSQEGYTLNFSKDLSDFSKETLPQETLSQDNKSWVLFMGKNRLGDGDPILGDTLIKMYFYTLSQSETLPQSILFMNDGVKLPSTHIEVIEHLRFLEEKGCRLLVCGACLDFYKLKDQLKVGHISNMYAMTEEMASVSKVVSL